jgi:hypothetical protein
MQDMKRAGLAGAQMIDVSMYIPQGSARYGSDEWFGDVQYAIHTAHELGLSFGMMNGPGWSGSGGPWVTPDLAMQRVVWNETNVDGGRKIRIRLDHPAVEADFYRDIAVVAVPADPKEELQPIVEAMPSSLFTAGDNDNAMGDSATVTFRYARPVERRTLELKCRQQGASGVFSGEIEASEDGERFQPIRHFDLRGEMGDPSLMIAFPLTTATVFRVRLDRRSQQMQLPALASMTLSSRVRIENFRSKTVSAVMRPVLDPSGLQTLDAPGIPLDEVIPLTGAMTADGMLEWDAPAGRWTILRFGYTPTGAKNHPAQAQGTGFEIDKMNAAATEFYFDHSLGRILKNDGALAGTTFNSVVIDSWECGQQNWTAALPTAFQAQRGYELERYLPVLTGRVLGSSAASEAFLRDFRKTISELVATNYYGTFRRLAEAHRLALYAETYDGTNFNEAESAAESGIPMTEFWAPPSAMDQERMSSIASAAHTLGRRVVASEAFTGDPAQATWSWSPQLLKPIGDVAFAAGVNRFVLHSYVHQPRSDVMPGFTLSRFGTHFGRLNTWWPQARPWLDYTARSSFLLQQGKHVADVLALGSEEINSLQTMPEPKLPAGYAFDWITPSALLTAIGTPQGISLAHALPYRALVLPRVWTADLAVLQRIEQFVAKGIPVFGERPVAPTSLRDFQQTQAWAGMVEALWPLAPVKRSVRPGMHVLPLDALEQVFASRFVPDIQFGNMTPAAAQPEVAWAHRQVDGTDLYFLANHEDAKLTVNTAFRSGDKQPELWNAVTGEHVDAVVFTRTKYGAEVPLELEPGGSIFVIFRRRLASGEVTAVADATGRRLLIDTAFGTMRFTRSGRYSLQSSDGSERWLVADLPAPVDLSADWTVRFQPPVGHSFDREFHRLHDFALDSDDQVRYFSGVATYRRILHVTPQQLDRNVCILELGDVHDIAVVRIDGHVLPALWTKPFSVDVTPWLKAGDHTLEIAVTDRWVNRMVGDEHLPADAEYAFDGGPMYSGRLAEFPDWYGDPAKTAARRRTSFATWQHFNINSQLVPAGLAGSVRLAFYRNALPQPKVH